MSFASPLELATYFNGTTDITDLSAEWIAQAQILLDMISADIESAAGVSIEEGSGTVVLPGTWSRDLLLPAGPIRAVSSVSLNGQLLDASGYYWNELAIIRRGVGPFDLDHDHEDRPEQGARGRSGRGWGGPAAAVAVAWDFGFVEVPAFVKSLTLRIAGRTFGNVANVTQESLAIYSVTYGKSTADSGSHVSDAERKRLRHALNRTGGTITAGGL